MLQAKNGSVKLLSGTTDYVRFGSGQKTMVMLPGVGDGLKTVRGMAVPFALLYRQLAGDFTVYMFSRRRQLDPHRSPPFSERASQPVCLVAPS